MQHAPVRSHLLVISAACMLPMTVATTILSPRFLALLPRQRCVQMTSRMQVLAHHVIYGERKVC